MEGATVMKAILEQHAQQLTDIERRAIWQAVRAPRAAGHGAPAHRALIAAVAALIAVAMWGMPARERAVEKHREAWITPVQRAPMDVRAQAEAPKSAPVAERPAPARIQRSPAVTRAPFAQAREAAAGAATDAASATALTERSAAEVAPAAPALASTGTLVGRVMDVRQRPVPFANVIVLGTRQGASTDDSGRFVVRGVPTGTHQVRLMAIGLDPLTKDVTIDAGQTTPLELVAGATRVVRELASIEVRGEKRIDTKASTTKQSITGERLLEIPVGNLSQATVPNAGMIAKDGELSFRGGRGGAVKFQFDGIAASPAAPTTPPVIPTAGGSRLPNDEAFDSMFFKHHGVNPFIATDEDALSTFAVDVDNASYTLMRRYIGLGHLPPADAVRVEEFVNFFPQGYPTFEGEDFRILIDGAPSPFGQGLHLVRVGLKGREVLARDRRPAQLTFVIDVSGSMAREDRLELVKRALRLLVDELRADDRVGIVIYGSRGHLLLEPMAVRGNGRQRIMEAIEQLRTEGSTNAEEGLQMGYAMARREYRTGANNRIVLCSDGVANVGRTGPQSILEQVRTEADRGISLTTIGFGMGNYNDVLMEQLADKGDGNHYYVDDIAEAQRVFVENLTGTLQTIAKDAKVQVEFDSTRVLRYRLIGFENRDVADRDFRNDKVDAGEIGAGHEVTALYEVKLAPGVTRGTLATVRLRYASPEQEGAGAPQVLEIEQRIDRAALAGRFENASARLRLDAAVAEFAEILRESYWARESKLSDVLAVARSAADALHEEASAEFVKLVARAAELRAGSAPSQKSEGR